MKVKAKMKHQEQEQEMAMQKNHHRRRRLARTSPGETSKSQSTLTRQWIGIERRTMLQGA